MAARLRPDVILLDMMMPGLDGPATLGLLKERAETARVPVIFLTARAGTVGEEELLGLGAEGVIAKPFDPRTLHEAIAGAIGWDSSSSTDTVGDLWLAWRPTAREGVRLVEAALTAAAGDSPTATLADARRAAHQLAGSLGTFGRPLGSAAAARAEAALQADPVDVVALRSAVETLFEVVEERLR